VGGKDVENSHGILGIPVNVRGHRIELRGQRQAAIVEEVGGGVSKRKCEEVESRVKSGNPDVYGRQHLSPAGDSSFNLIVASEISEVY
jgi:hypothetical protein